MPNLPTADEQLLIPMFPDAARFLGLGRAAAYELTAKGEFPIEVLRIGGRLRVRTRDLRRLLGLDE